ncbi:MAG TPA: T9SS type A sorting domain-containing protein [Bacteroidia bacterium]|jgi:hypothetical protein|nr:T9SS type A sorting domain-containing protein [Bacteroidia bacterium]
MPARFLILILFSTVVSEFQAQADTAWVYTYGGPADEVCNQIRPAPGKGFILCGTTSSFGPGYTNLYIIRTDSVCKPLWSAAYGGRANQAGYAVTPTQDKGFAFAGYTNSFGNGGYDAWLVKTDSAGKFLWQKTYGGTDWDFAYALKETPDGGFILCGLTFSRGAGNGDLYLIRTRSNGDTVWTRTFGGAGCDIGNSITLSGDSLYTIAGSTTSFGGHDTSIYLIQVDTNGVLRNSKTYGCMRNSVAWSIAPTDDKGYVIMGGMDSVYSGIRGQMLLKTDAHGNQQWIEQLTNGTWTDIGKDVVQAKDASFLIAGSADGGGYGSSSMHVMHYDSVGNYLSGPSFGGNSTQCGNSVALGVNGTVVFAGATTSYGNGNEDFFLVRYKNDSIVQNPFQVMKNYADTLAPAGVHEQQATKVNVEISPNPLIIQTRIRIQGSCTGVYSLCLYDINGHCLRKDFPLHRYGHGLSELMLERDELSKGIYLFTIGVNTGISYSGKLIVE